MSSTLNPPLIYSLTGVEPVAGSGPTPCYRGRMSSAGEGPSGARDDEAEVDTIEMELRPEDLALFASLSAEHAVSVEVIPPPAKAVSAELAAGLAPKPQIAPIATGPAPTAAVAKAAPIAVEMFTPVAIAQPVPLRAAPAPGAVESRAPGKAGSRWVAVTAAAGVVAVAAGLVGFLGLDVFRTPAPPPPAAPAFAELTPLSLSVARIPEPPPPQGAVVTFRNPFDRSEVFEFPPGTSRSDARAAVAQILLERARDRPLPAAKPTQQAADK